MIDGKVCWGIAGLGKVAHRFANDLTKHVGNGQLYAVAARNSERARLFSNEYSCKISYGSYLMLAQDPDIDAV